MRFRAKAIFEKNTGLLPLASMHSFGLTTSNVVLLKSSGAREHTSGEEYTSTLCDASLKPLDRREAKAWSPVVGGRTIASVSICMPHLRYQASSFNAIRCPIDKLLHEQRASLGDRFRLRALMRLFGEAICQEAYDGANPYNTRVPERVRESCNERATHHRPGG
jgi:hypothetical protein